MPRSSSPRARSFYAFVERVSNAFGLDPDVVVATLDSFEDARGVVAVIGIGLLLLALLPWVSAVQRGIVNAFEEGRRSYVRTTLSSLLLLGLAGILILLSGVWGSLVTPGGRICRSAHPGPGAGRRHRGRLP